MPSGISDVEGAVELELELEPVVLLEAQATANVKANRDATICFKSFRLRKSFLAIIVSVNVLVFCKQG